MCRVRSRPKDRWRQVLAEATKNPRKHLLALEPGVSEPQTTQTAHSNLQPILPPSIQESYTAVQHDRLWNLGEFIREVEARACR